MAVTPGRQLISPAIYANRDSKLAAAKQTDNQLNLFFRGLDGAVWVSWVTGIGNWQGPMRVTSAGVLPAGGDIAAARQTNNQLDIFFVDAQGAVNVGWVTGVGNWQGPVRLTATGFAPAGAGVAAAHQFSNQLDLFMVGNDGAVYVMWVVGTGNWNGPARITNTYQSSPGAPVVSMKQLPNQLDAFFSGLRGGLWVAWVVDAGLWSGPISLTQTGLPVDVTVSLWRNPSTTDRQTYEEIIDHFADGVFESSNGANRLRNIFIYTGGGKRDCTDIIWDSMGWPQASASGTALGCGEQLQYVRYV